MDAKTRFTEEVIEILKNEISGANGNEVFFTGEIDINGKVISVKAAARGDLSQVPVNYSYTNEASCSVLIHNHPSGKLAPSKADMGVAEYQAQNAQGFYIINNSVTEVYVVVEPVKPKAVVSLDIDDTAAIISKGGQLDKISKNFEERPVQIQLLKNIAQVINQNKIGVFEAGTGVGKSYAYLIPAVLWSLNNKERIVISTGTINLQQQLCQKDIPMVEKILGKKIKFILMKGRQNFVCLRRLKEAGATRDLFDEEISQMDSVIEWANITSTGDKSELTFMPSENVWSKVNSESDACMGNRCPYHSECFIMKLRKEANSANIIVVNHHLLFADIDSRMNGIGYEEAAVLPPYKRVVFDEAHGIENAATSFFSQTFTRFKLNKLIMQMYKSKKGSNFGLVYNLAVLSSSEEKADLIPDIVKEIKSSLVNLELSAKDVLEKDYTLRVCDKTSRKLGPVFVAMAELEKALKSFLDVIRIIIDGISDDDRDAPCLWEAKLVIRRLDNYALLLKDFSEWEEHQNSVFWIQKKYLPFDLAKEGQENDYYVFNQTPLDISLMMNSGVYEPLNSVVCTSATLKIARDFKYWMARTGVSYVETERVQAKDFPSPFPFHKNMIIAVPKDAPFVESMEYQQYIEMAIPKLINASNGRTLVLFTSYDSLKSAHNACRIALKGFTGRIMRQGEDDNNKLLEAFRNENESVLFATDSFWQGVDIPGESLSQVIIVKLPFTVPSDPVFVARAEAIEKRGGSSFMELSIPEAVIKFRQGVGRLIRRSDDRGAVVILDKRIYEKRYGSIFLASIAECKQYYEPLSDLVKRINNFIFA